MPLLARVASVAATLSCILGLGTLPSAGHAAEIAAVAFPAVTLPATIGQPTLPLAALSTPTAPLDAAPRFASLEEAVAAQDADLPAGADAAPAEIAAVAAVNADAEPAADPATVACLAGAIYFEAKGEPLPGQLAVADVILHRARSGRFPPDVCGVVTQRGQFSFVRDGRLPAIDAAARGYRTAVAMARVALAAAWDDPAAGALFFHARRIGAGRGTQVAAIGNHIFYR